MAATSAIRAAHISKNYGSFRAVDDLTFDVYAGEIFAMLGPNGAGKSTTIRMILDILKPDTGSIEVLGAPINDATKDRIGYLPEERGLYRNAPVLDVMTYLGTLKGMKSADARRKSLAFLERLELGDFAKKKVTELSKGMQQKVQFAVTVLHDPDLIIIDEPFSGLDPLNTQVIEGLIDDFRAKGGAIVMSTHQMHQVETMASRLLMIDRGQQKLYGRVDEVRRRYALPAVIVEGEGDWASLPGVERVETNADRGAATLYLANGVESGDLFHQIAARPDMQIRRFELALPSLNDIFIHVVQDAPMNGRPGRVAIAERSAGTG